MSLLRGLISGGNHASRISGVHGMNDALRVSTCFDAGTKRLGSPRMAWSTPHTSPGNFYLNPDGTKLFVISGFDYVYQYTLSTPFDPSTASQNGYWNFTEYESSGEGLEFSPDGKYLYLGGHDRDTVLQFTLASPWNVVTEPDAGWEQKAFRKGNIINAGVESEASLRGIEFGNNGTKLYMVGYSNDNVEQYSLSTAYAVSTMTSDGRYDLADQGITGVYSIRWKPDGTKFYITDIDGDDVVEFSVTNAWDVTSGTVTEGTNYYVGGQETAPVDVAFNTDGTKMFVLGDTGNGIDEYSLSTGYDLSSTVAHVRHVTLNAGNTTPNAFDFSPDGTKLTVVNFSNDSLYYYTLSTGFDITTLSAGERVIMNYSEWASPSSLGDNGQSSGLYAPYGFRYHGGGYSFTALDYYSSSFDALKGWNMRLPYETNTVFEGFKNINASPINSDQPTGVRFKPGGYKWYVLDASDDKINQFTLTYPYVLGNENVSHDGASSTFSIQDSGPRGFDFSPDGKNLFVCGTSGDRIIHYTVETAWDVTSTLTHTNTFDTTAIETSPREIRIIATPDGYQLWMIGDGSDDLFVFDFNF
jgi:6-phosphogluconolactonase (cycloisomerase 2 family)